MVKYVLSFHSWRKLELVHIQNFDSI